VDLTALLTSNMINHMPVAVANVNDQPKHKVMAYIIPQVRAQLTVNAKIIVKATMINVILFVSP
jgi:hypothetical protein